MFLMQWLDYITSIILSFHLRVSPHPAGAILTSLFAQIQLYIYLQAYGLVCHLGNVLFLL